MGVMREPAAALVVPIEAGRPAATQRYPRESLRMALSSLPLLRLFPVPGR